MKNIKVGDNVKIKLNRGYFGSDVAVGDIGEVVEVEDNGDIHLVINDLGQDVEAELVDKYLEIIQDSAPEPIDFSKAQVFDPPILLEVSDYPDFPKQKTDKMQVWAIYPEFYYPIRTFEEGEKSGSFVRRYAREIKEDAFEEFYKDKYSETDLNTVKTALKAFWKAGVRHGKENK